MTASASVVALRLAECEAIIERGLGTFVEVGDALRQIRNDGLYKQAGFSKFEAYCQTRWGWSRQRSYQLMDAAAVSNMLDTRPANARQAAELAPLMGDEAEVLEVWRELKAEHGEKLTAKLVRRTVQNRLARIAREDDARQVPAVPSSLPPTIQIFERDFRELELAAASVDLIFTDPPYPAEFLDLWYDLGEFAARVLKPGHLLVAYSGQFHLPEVIQALCSHLEYVWSGSLVTPGDHTQIMQRKVRSWSKPILFFAAAGEPEWPWFEDTFESEGPSKDRHDWEQSEGAARHFLERLSEPGELVCDPFLGSGTTASAAATLGRDFIGCDVDPAALAIAKARFA